VKTKSESDLFAIIQYCNYAEEEIEMSESFRKTIYEVRAEAIREFDRRIKNLKQKI